MNGKLYIKKFIRDDGETLSFDAEEIYLSENNTLLVRSDPATTAVEFTEEDGGEMIRQRGATYSQPVSGLIVPKSTEYWALCVRLSRFFILNHTYKIVYIKRDGSMFSMNRAWINAGLQIVPVPYENYSTWTVEFRIGDNFWTEYAEDSQGKEIYSNSVELPLLTAGTGGEVWNDITQQTLSGLGNYFTIYGTSISASINKLEVRGDTFQQSYTGNNLSPYPYSDGSSKVIRGITFTAASDGSVTLNGTNDGTANSAYYIRYSDSSSLQFEAGTYYFIPPSDTNVVYAMYDGTSYYDFDSSNNYSRTFPTAKNIRYIYIQVRRGNTTVFNNLKIYPMLTTSPNPTESDYEPYVGGIPAPNPGYPQAVQTVTGEQTVKITGKNLFDINESSKGIYASTMDIAGDSITVTQASSNANALGWISIPNSDDLLGKTATISVQSFVSGSGSTGPRIMVGASTGREVYTLRPTSSEKSATFTFPSSYPTSANGFRLYFYANTANTGGAVGAYSSYSQVQLEVGTAATSYDSYHLQSYTINLGKNLFNKSDTSTQLPNTYINTTGVLQAGTNTGTVFAKCQPNATYTVSKSLSARFIIGETATLPADGVTVSNIIRDDTATHLTITTGPTAQYIVVFCHHSSDTMTLAEIAATVQIEAGSVASQYASYFTPIELCKIDDYQDYIYKSGDDWYVHKETEKMVLDGTTNAMTGVYTNGMTEDYNFCSKRMNDMKSGAQVGYCSYLISSTGSPNGANRETIFFGTQTNNYLYMGVLSSRTGGLRTLTAFNNYLETHPATLYYVLATSTDTKITDATLVSQLEALAGAQAYNGKTVYQTNSATMPAILSVELLQSVGGGETWDNVGAVWEEGVGGVQTINVETTQTTYPVWTVTGPCSNPTLQNDTTDTIASFDGMIASGQTLTVDFADNTAYLDSAPVAKYVSGYVSLAPGENAIGFNSDGGSTQTSTISWNNIIN